MKYFHLYKQQPTTINDYDEIINIEKSVYRGEDSYISQNNFTTYLNSSILKEYVSKHRGRRYFYGQIFEDNKKREFYEGFCFRLYGKNVNLEFPETIMTSPRNHACIRVEMCK